MGLIHPSDFVGYSQAQRQCQCSVCHEDIEMAATPAFRQSLASPNDPQTIRLLEKPHSIAIPATGGSMLLPVFFVEVSGHLLPK